MNIKPTEYNRPYKTAGSPEVERKVGEMVKARVDEILAADPEKGLTIATLQAQSELLEELVAK